MACPYCCNNAPAAAPRRGSGFLGTILKVLLVYVALVFTGGTLIKTGHPVAVETGRLIQTVTMIDPAIRWTQNHGWSHVASGLQIVAGGVRVS
jgi:hypothetical protein